MRRGGCGGGGGGAGGVPAGGTGDEGAEHAALQVAEPAQQVHCPGAAERGAAGAAECSTVPCPSQVPAERDLRVAVRKRYPAGVVWGTPRSYTKLISEQFELRSKNARLAARVEEMQMQLEAERAKRRTSTAPDHAALAELAGARQRLQSWRPQCRRRMLPSPRSRHSGRNWYAEVGGVRV